MLINLFFKKYRMNSTNHNDSKNFDDYVFVEEYWGDEDEWDDTECTLLDCSEWPDVDDASIDLSQSPSSVSVGSLVDDEEEGVTEATAVVHQTVISNSEDETKNAVSAPMEKTSNDKISSAFSSSNAFIIDLSVPDKKCSSRMCNKKRRKKMKELRKTIAKSNATAPSTIVSAQTEDRSRYLNKVGVSLMNMVAERSKTSKIASMYATEALSTYRYAHSLKTKANYSILI